MCERIEDVVAAMRAAVLAFDPSRLPAAHATKLVELFAEGERLCAAGRTLAAGRVSDSFAWHASGYRNAAQWVASRTQGTLGQAITMLETARHLEKLPATREAFVSGRLSEIQTAEIAAAAVADANAEGALLAMAKRDTVAQLKEQCRQVRAAAVGDEDAVERIRRGRYLRNWIDRDGAVRLDGRFAPDDGGNSSLSSRRAQLRFSKRRGGPASASALKPTRPMLSWPSPLVNQRPKLLFTWTLTLRRWNEGVPRPARRVASAASVRSRWPLRVAWLRMQR